MPAQALAQRLRAVELLARLVEVHRAQRAAAPAALGRRSLARVRDLIDDMFGQRFSLEGVSQVLHRLDWSPAQRNGSVMRSGQGSRTGWSPRGGESTTLPHV